MGVVTPTANVQYQNCDVNKTQILLFTTTIKYFYVSKVAFNLL